jgi:hypothetical protein
MTRLRSLARSGALLLVVSCTVAPASLEDCAGVPEPAAREECHYTFIAPLLSDPPSLDAALASIEDPASRDLLLLRLAIADPKRAAALCKRVASDGAKERCRQVLGRPHLQSTRRPPQPPTPPATP